ncbi:uncharacterized protein Bfra_005782 [Botrytis fragariae]|uniref:Uncharacterized protein n=1 Tax=Botrytis fragariae TaxID=1964551 RepID=A0A8H6AR45_9HELO|nr:uncharacterized protein Bfra_005782 [Botrytis fragariae]KAF5872423.1 hypothetical protein Bfra_005782 [Botrytis fragariae]
MFATSNVNFLLSILPTVSLPTNTILFLPIATYGRMAQSPEPLKMFDDEGHYIYIDDSAYLALVLDSLPLSKGFEVPSYVFSDIISQD